MQWKDDLTRELKRLEANLASKSRELEEGFDSIEAKQKEREGDRKTIFLREMKKLLIILNDVDKKVTKDLKNEAFDNIRCMNKVKEEVAALTDKLSTSDVNIAAGEAIKSLNILKTKFTQIDEDFPTSSLSLSVSNSPERMSFLTHTVAEAVYLKTPTLDSHHYSLDCSPMFSPNAVNDSLIELRLHCTLPTRQFNALVLSKLVLSMHCPDGSHFQSKRILEEGTLAELIKKKKAFVSTPSSVMVQIKKPKNLIVSLEVKLLESNILNSPRVISFLSRNGNDTAPQDVTRLDTTGTGQLCQADLDITELDRNTPSTAPTSPQSASAQAPVTATLPTTTLATPCNQPVTTVTSPETVNIVNIRSDTEHDTSPGKHYTADPFGSPHSPLQPTGPTPPKLCRQSSNIPHSPSDPSHCPTYLSSLDTSDPLLLLNASLAPGSQTLNATYLPDSCWDDSKWCPSPPSTSLATANTTMWDVETAPQPGLFLSSKLQGESVYRARQVSLSKTRTTSVLISPYDITSSNPLVLMDSTWLLSLFMIGLECTPPLTWHTWVF